MKGDSHFIRILHNVSVGDDVTLVSIYNET